MLTTATLADLEAEMLAFVPEGDSAAFSSTQRTVHINNALREHAMAGNWWWFRVRETVDLDLGKSAIPISVLDHNVRRIIRVVLVDGSGRGDNLEPMSAVDLEHSGSRTGSPVGYNVDDLKIRIAPTADQAYELDIYYQTFPDKLSAPGDDSGVPILYQGVVSLRAAANKLLQEGNPQASDLVARYRETERRMMIDEEHAQVEPPETSRIYSDNPLARTSSPWFYGGNF